MSDTFYGEIRPAAFGLTPRGWAPCNGQMISFAQNTALFSILGTTYGGDGRVTFALPDMRGRVAIAAGQGPGLTPRVQGDTVGIESIALIPGEVPSHSHDMKASSLPGNRTTPAGNTWAADSSGRTMDYQTGAPNGGMAGALLSSNNTPAQPHDNMQPYLGVQFMIALIGIFPTRS